MVIEEGRIMGHVQWRDRHGGGAFGGRLMITQRVERLAGAALLVTLGVQGLSSPLAHVALMRSTPDCIEAGLMAASVGMEIHLLSAGPDCVKGSYAPAASYHVVAQAALTVSLTALVLGVLAMILTVGVGLHARQVVRQLRGWVARRDVSDRVPARAARHAPRRRPAGPDRESSISSPRSTVLLLLRT